MSRPAITHGHTEARPEEVQYLFADMSDHWDADYSLTLGMRLTQRQRYTLGKLQQLDGAQRVGRNQHMPAPAPAHAAHKVVRIRRIRVLPPATGLHQRRAPFC